MKKLAILTIIPFFTGCVSTGQIDSLNAPNKNLSEYISSQNAPYLSGLTYQEGQEINVTVSAPMVTTTTEKLDESGNVIERVIVQQIDRETIKFYDDEGNLTSEAVRLKTAKNWTKDTAHKQPPTPLNALMSFGSDLLRYGVIGYLGNNALDTIGLGYSVLDNTFSRYSSSIENLSGEFIQGFETDIVIPNDLTTGEPLPEFSLAK